MHSARQHGRVSIRSRIHQLINAISAGMYEREEIVSVALLGALCGQSTFLYGPPGTAKSLISRRIACAFHQPAYFEYLMNRFSTPEEVFGPVSIKALKEDHYLRKTANYLPTADFAFLDEIWKASPAILNTLLTLINERIFKNGDTVEQAPLKALLAASNETPDANQGLEALFDRFIVRLMVAPISQMAHFDTLLNSKPSVAEVNVPDSLRITPDEWRDWLDQIHTVALSSETLTIIHLIRARLAEQYDALQIYVSDRRWQRAALLMKAAAFFNGRTQTNHSDALLLHHCIWTHKDNHDAVAEMVAEAVRSTGIDSGSNLAGLDGKKASLEQEIEEELFYSADVYDIEKNAVGDDVFKFIPSSNFRTWDYHHGTKPVYLLREHLKSTEQFHPMDANGNEVFEFDCVFEGQGTCKITECRTRQSVHFTPEILFHRGDKRRKINVRLVGSLAKSISEIKAELVIALKKSRSQFTQQESQLASLFVPAEKTNLAIAGIAEQIASLQLRIKDCERLEGLCR